MLPKETTFMQGEKPACGAEQYPFGKFWRPVVVSSESAVNVVCEPTQITEELAEADRRGSSFTETTLLFDAVQPLPFVMTTV